MEGAKRAPGDLPVDVGLQCQPERRGEPAKRFDLVGPKPPGRRVANEITTPLTSSMRGSSAPKATTKAR